MKPARACIYYLHEVPGEYLGVPKVLVIKEDEGEGPISSMTILSAADMALYKDCGQYITAGASTTKVRGLFAGTFVIAQEDPPESNVINDRESVTTEDLYSVKGKVLITDGASCISDGSYTMVPYWTTYDEVTVKGTDVEQSTAHSRSITVSGNEAE